MRRTLFYCSIILLFTAMVPGSSAQTLQPPKSLTPSRYIIQPNDVLQIFFWKEPTLSLRVTVRPDGYISFPLVQDLQAAGLNPEELKQKAEERLKPFFDIPNITVIVDAIQSYRIYVLGKVAKQGAIMNEKPLSVLQALTMAGGALDFADTSNIRIIRGSGEDGNPFTFSLPDFMKGKNYSQNMLLNSGDVVFVP